MRSGAPGFAGLEITTRLVATLVGLSLTALGGEPPGVPSALPGTAPLTMQGDIASELVAGADRFLLRQIEKSAANRQRHWKRDLSSAQAYNASIEPNRKRLAHILGVRDPRVAFDGPRLVGTLDRPDLLASAEKYNVLAVRWPAFGDVSGEGLQLEPGDRIGVADVIVIPDADTLPEQLAGLMPGLPPDRQVARRLAESGCRVIVPVLIDRTVEPRNGRAKLTNREFVYRPAFELGRHILGYEVQEVLALVDWLSKQAGSDAKARIGVFGHGEGGGIALYAAALDPRIDAACVSGYIDDRNNVWTQPIDRNVFGLLDQFGDAELAAMVAPRRLIIEAAKGPEFVYGPGQGGGPGKLTTPRSDTVVAEFRRAQSLIMGLPVQPGPLELFIHGPDGQDPPGTSVALRALLGALDPTLRLADVQPLHVQGKISEQSLRDRQARQVHELDRHSQQLLVESPYVREKFMEKLDTTSPQAYSKTIEPYREFFATQVIGRFDEPLLPPNVRSRKVFDEPKFTGYEVVMDVFPDVIAYGILLLPKGIKEGEKRPVVVCQHGLEGRPSYVADPKVENPSYHKYAVRLAERGFITFAPQNLYIFEDRFRTLQRKANLLGKTLFSIIVPQHQQITDWLKTLPQVDGTRIGFYGLSYGGKSAMRIPPLVKNYALSICSADFNEWVWKNASTRSPYSYVWGGEYEIFEFDLGSTFNYAEMAALIAPRPFMVERGHFDGVAPDETVAYEFAKVFRLYDARLHLGDRCTLEVFNGPHTINGQGTFRFLHQHLTWPEPRP
jgi:dienelactone hydrolase